MKGRKSSYDKLFIFIIIIILSINIILGIVAITVSSTIYKQSRLDELQKIGDLFTSCMEDSYSERMNVRSSLIKKLHKRFSSKYHLMIYIYDESGNCVLSDADYEENPKKVVKNSSKISEKERELITKGGYLVLETQSISADEPYMLYGTCFFLQDEIMYAKIYTNSNAVNSFSARLIMFYSLFCLLSTFIQAFILSRRFKRIILDFMLE